MPDKRKIAITTLGCRFNQHEAEQMLASLGDGWEQVPVESADADVLVINSCTVTAKSDAKCRQLVKRARELSKTPFVVLAGCYPEAHKETAKLLPGVNLVLGTREKLRLGDYLAAGIARENDAGAARCYVGEVSGADGFSGAQTGVAAGRTSAYIKVQEGCEADCSFCIVPSTRGRYRSADPAWVVERVDSLAHMGVREAVLTGINLGKYGIKTGAGLNLVHLLRAILDRTAIARLRLSSINPMEVTPELIELISAEKRICRHLHIPLQSGSDEILRLMKRDYTAGYYASLIESVTRRIPGICVGADVITGFPGETERMFDVTKRLIESLPIGYLHVFSYSVRPNTPAAALPGRVQAREIARRRNILREIAREKKESFALGFIGRELEVLVERTQDGKTGLLKGFSDNYIPVLLDASKSGIGTQWYNTLVTATPAGFSNGRLLAIPNRSGAEAASAR